MKIDLIMVIINLVLMLFAVAVLVKIILRTEKGLDKAFKLLIISPIVLSITSFMQMDKLAGVLPREYSQMLFYGSRFIANVAFLIACVVFLKTFSKLKK